MSQPLLKAFQVFFPVAFPGEGAGNTQHELLSQPTVGCDKQMIRSVRVCFVMGSHDEHIHAACSTECIANSAGRKSPSRFNFKGIHRRVSLAASLNPCDYSSNAIQCEQQCGDLFAGRMLPSCGELSFKPSPFARSWRWLHRSSFDAHALSPII